MSLRRGRQRAELIGDINVVSLIDVMMLLLVIFMITAPIMQGGVEVQLPTGDESAVEADKSGVVVTLTKQDSVFIGSVAYTFRSFSAAAKSVLPARAKNGVFIAADSSVKVQRLIDVMDVLRRAGLTNLSILKASKDQ